MGIWSNSRSIKCERQRKRGRDHELEKLILGQHLDWDH